MPLGCRLTKPAAAAAAAAVQGRRAKSWIKQCKVDAYSCAAVELIAAEGCHQPARAAAEGAVPLS